MNDTPHPEGEAPAAAPAVASAAGDAEMGVLDVARCALRYMDPHNRRLVWFLGALHVTNASLEAIGVGLLFPLVQIVNDPARAADFAILNALFELLGFRDQSRYGYLVIGLMVAVFTVKSAMVFASNVWQIWYIRRNESMISRTLLWRYVSAPYSMYFTRNSVELTRNLLDCVSAMYTGVLNNLIRFATELLLAAAVVFALFLVDPSTATFVTIAVGLVALVIYRQLKPRVEHLGARKISTSSERLKAVREVTGMVKELKILRRENYFADFFLEIQLRYSKVLLWTTALTDVPRYAFELLIVWVVCGVILLSLESGRDGAEVIASLGVFAGAAFRLAPCANRLVVALSNLRQVLPGARAIVADMETMPIERPKRLAPDGEAAAPFQKLEVRDVVYRYPGEPAPVLHGVSLTIERGQSVAVVGPSGGGKTTLIDLILGLLTPLGGRVLLNGRDIQDQLADWREILGYVPQDIFLLDDTLRRNVAIGIADDKVDDAAVASAITSAHLTAYVAGLTDGVDTRVGEHGIRMSGGQRQRIGIARSLYRDPQFLVLDEATSNLDSETERNFAETVQGFRGVRTTLIIAHRLSTVRECDKIVVLKDGRILDVGGFDELADRCAEFARMVELGELSRAT